MIPWMRNGGPGFYMCTGYVPLQKGFVHQVVSFSNLILFPLYIFLGQTNRFYTSFMVYVFHILLNDSESSADSL
jgi:hypothetical protein